MGRGERREAADGALLGRDPLAAGPGRDLLDARVRVVQQGQEADLGGDRAGAVESGEGGDLLDGPAAHRRLGVGQRCPQVGAGERAETAEGAEGSGPHAGVVVVEARPGRRHVARVTRLDHAGAALARLLDHRQSLAETPARGPVWQSGGLVDPSHPAPPIQSTTPGDGGPAAAPGAPAPPAGAPPGHAPAPARVPIRLRWHPIWFVLGAMLMLTATSVGLAGLVRAPYVVYAPGSAIPTEPAISAPGTETFATDGEVLFLTVSLRGASRRLGYLEAFWGWLQPEQDVYPRDAILGDQTGEENREASVQEMAMSQEVATTVALEELGYEVPISGTGTVVSDVIAETPAADVLEPFDVITELDGVATGTDADLRDELADRAPGEVVEVRFERGADAVEDTAQIELVADPDDPDRALLGVVGVFTRDLTFDFPFTVRIDTEDVGGPSAGLALTLGILDVLTPGSITGGHDVAVTGTISTDGVVGEVGGVAQKAVAANRTDADVLLVPAAEAELAERFADPDVEVIGVATLDDALAALAELGGNADALVAPDGG